MTPAADLRRIAASVAELDEFYGGEPA